MGNCCGSNSNLLIAQPILINNKQQRQHSQKQMHKFKDIKPEDSRQLNISKLELNNLQQDLQVFLQEYQIRNGIISRRLTNRPFQDLSNNFRNINFQSDFQKNPITKTSTEGNIINNQMSKQNIFLQIENQSSFSSSQQTNKKQQKYSCLLTSQSNILNKSLFTQRIKSIQAIYQKHNQLNQKKLINWSDFNRESLIIKQQVLYLKIKQGKNEKILLVLFKIIQYYKCFKISLLSFMKNPLGLKIYMNGKKRAFPFPKYQQSPSLQLMIQNFSSIQSFTKISQLMYLLVGWIPQQIKVSEIKNIDQVLQRIATNMYEGHNLVTLTLYNKQQQINVVLNYIDLENGIISYRKGRTTDILNNINLVKKDLILNQQCIRIQNFKQIFNTINLNWNPAIYDLSIKREGIFQKKQNKQILKKYKLIIPPSSQDIQIRLFVQKHHDYNGKNNNKNIIVSLYQYENSGIQIEQPPIRRIISSSNLYSDVFIFQSCKQKTIYLLTLKLQDQQQINEQICFSITLYSFVDMIFDQIYQKKIIKQIQYTHKIKQQQIGYGINSPYFANNYQVCLNVQLQHELLITIDAEEQYKYQICLIPDNQQKQNLLKIPLQTIINYSVLSHQKSGHGNFVFKAVHKNYIFMLNSYTLPKQSLNIKICMFGSNVQIPTLQIKPSKKMNDIFFKQNIKWSQSHYGPRKRLKSNSVQTFQPAQVFIQFFQNPILDKVLVKGKYQFYCQSQTYKQYFDSLQSYDQKNSCEPPALSLAIFQVKKQKKQFKIIQDDAFYIPFGVGFWSKQIQFQQGLYRFVMPQMQKSYAKGSFGIIKC